ncbi:2-hydroxy-acid oxidase [Amylibacter marinus]|uniref:D-lactate dehydrogenase (cytochrome) n=1 Tax=Amylibacter marinus TaxID=1475483 RepID=A0ABQ5VUU2_9RHOB|nr:FAD-linked oxidase C-terminal domain-containing protein [Amylibacter marinus]GLQ34858.1 2-hydroxy-acid oxidase [Amylibacter marinus]
MSKNASAINEIQAFLGERLNTSAAVRALHGQNEAHYPEMPPEAVAFPNSTAEVSEIVKICAKHRCPIIPWGTGTSLEGHALPVQGGITVSLQNMSAVLEVLPEDLLAVVQPGLTREALNKDLRATGLFFPVDPGANASLGGMAATRASGTTAVRYGTMKENIRALEVVLADGRIIRTGSRAKKSSTGYDLTKLFVGSEGTLGIITEMTLELQGQPEAIAAAVCDFDDIESAINTVIMAVQMGVPIARMELVDGLSIKAINAYSKLSYPEKPHLFMEFHGSEVAVKDQSETMREISADFQGGDFQWSTRSEERNALWAARHNAYYAMKALYPNKRGMATDVCVPISKLAQAITETIADLDAHGVSGMIIGHAGDGNYHSTLFVDPDQPDELALHLKLAHRMAERGLALGGTVSGEHGIGVGKQKFMAAEHGDAVSVMADIKRSFDPDNIMNPGKLVPMN